MVSSRLLEAFLACPVKCHLLSEGELPAGTEYSAWVAAREESCRREGVRKLTSQEMGPSIAAAEPGRWKQESWRFAVGKTVRAEGWEAEIALIQRITLMAGSRDPFRSRPVVDVFEPSEEFARHDGQLPRLGLDAWPPVHRRVRIGEWLNVLPDWGDDCARQ